MRHDGRVVAVLSRDANLAMPRVPSPLEIAYLGSASDLCQMVADGTFPPRAAVVGADTSPRAGDGLIRLDALGLVAYASPNALSAYHRMGHASDLVGLSLAAATRGLVADPFDAAEIAARIEGALAGRHSLRMEVAAQGASMLVRALPLRPAGRRGGRAGAGPRRHRAAPPRPGAAVQGRHDPRDPPPGEEQPADGGRAAAPAGPAHGDPGGPAGARRRACGGSTRSRWCTSRCRRRSPSGSTSTSWSTGCCPRSATAPRPTSRAKVRRDGSFGILSAALATPLVLVLTELVHNALAHAFDPGTTGEVVVTAQPLRRHARRRGVRRRQRAAARLRRRRVGGLGPSDRAHPAGVGAGLHAVCSASAGRGNGGRHHALIAGALTSAA